MDNNAVVNELSKSMGRDAKDIAALLDGITAIMREKLSAMDSIAIPDSALSSRGQGGRTNPKRPIDRKAALTAS